MRINIKLNLLTLFAALAISCGKTDLVSYESGKNRTTQLTLNFDRLNLPITVAGTEGPVFFETDDGKFWLQGKPFRVEKSDTSWSAIWKIENREVNILFWEASGHYAFSFTAVPGEGILGWGMNLTATHDEYFTGLFERTVDGDQKESWREGIETAMDLRGEKVDMLIKPTLSLYTPFYLSSENYGLFVKGTWPGHYDFCRSDSNRVQISFEGPTLSGIIYTSTDPAEIVKAHALRTGPTIVPPKWAFLPWRWRDNHTNLKTYYDGSPVNAPYNSQVVEDILMMKAFDIPCGVYWVDRPWAIGEHGYADFEWDPQRFPDAVRMIDWIHGRDMRFILWIAPWVTGNMRTEAISKGYTQVMKPANWGVDSSNAALLDFTNPEACRWWQQNGIGKMLEQGVDGFKLDRSEELVPETRDILFFDGRTAREVRNDYPVHYVKTVHEVCRDLRGDDFMLIPRAGYTGSSKYSGFWGGDIGSPPEGLRAAIIALQRSAIIGFPIWGSDIGGYWQGDLDREVCARWLAFGCFNPIMEFGPTEDRAPWNMRSGESYDIELLAIWRLYAKIHATLADYSFTRAKEAHETGMPVVRPLFLQFPKQPDAWKDWQTYMYGPDILVSAIWEKGVTKHKLYLPEGERWIDAWNTAAVTDGGQWVEVETPMYKIPVFIREGAAIALGDMEALYRQSIAIVREKPDLQKLEKEAFKE
jgi:alpha-glucosidase (family GH31 glycosyl hydrolase)